MAATTNIPSVNNMRSILNLVDVRINGAAPSTVSSRRSPLAAGGPIPRTWRFVLLVEPAPQAPPRPIVLEPAFVRGLGPGATLLREPYEPTVKLRFDWPAPTQGQALVAAIRAVEAAGLRVLRVDNDDWVTAADVAHRVGRSRETVRKWAAGLMGPGGFPPPANPRRDTIFYSWAELLPWLRERKGLDLPEEQPALVAANLAVQLRALLPRLPLRQVFIDLLD